MDLNYTRKELKVEKLYIELTVPLGLQIKVDAYFFKRTLQESYDYYQIVHENQGMEQKLTEIVGIFSNVSNVSLRYTCRFGNTFGGKNYSKYNEVHLAFIRTIQRRKIKALFGTDNTEKFTKLLNCIHVYAMASLYREKIYIKARHKKPEKAAKNYKVFFKSLNPDLQKLLNIYTYADSTFKERKSKENN